MWYRNLIFGIQPCPVTIYKMVLSYPPGTPSQDRKYTKYSRPSYFTSTQIIQITSSFFRGRKWPRQKDHRFKVKLFLFHINVSRCFGQSLNISVLFVSSRTRFSDSSQMSSSRLKLRGLLYAKGHVEYVCDTVGKCTRRINN